MTYRFNMIENEIAHNDELGFIHQEANIAIRYIIGFLLVGWAIYKLIGFSTKLWASLLIGVILVAVQKIHTIDKISMTVSNYIGIGIPFVNLWYKLILLSKKTIDGTIHISVKSESYPVHTDHYSGSETDYRVQINHESGFVVLSTFKSFNAAQKMANEIKEFLSRE